ncbi:MAG TPA: hypothetical protein VHX38_06660 [Pseudonocardiaceae bacterium]|nr:hypothetical protein [Pseudonocardiaceae bacterium]
MFDIDGAVCNVTFDAEQGVSAFLDFYLARGNSDVIARLYLTPQGEKFPSANLRFQFNRDHQVAAAVLIAADRDGHQHSWLTRGDAGRDDVVLVHDTGNPVDTQMPPDAFITVSELRDLVTQWVLAMSFPLRPCAGQKCRTCGGSD